MLMDAYRGDERPGIRIAYRTDGQLLNQRRMQLQSHVSTTMVHELLFADDCALNTTSGGEMQRSMDLFCRLRELRPSHQHAEDSGDAPTATQLSRHSPRRAAAAANQRERNPTASGGELPVPGQYSLPQHQDRRRSRQPDLESQSSLRSPPKHSLESSWSSTKHEAEDVQGRHSADATVWSGDLDGLHKAGTPSEPLPPQLSSSHPELELAGPNSRH
ncbi:hypothetical protein SprV_0602042400 [Sparganum proliferum]